MTTTSQSNKSKQLQRFDEAWLIKSINGGKEEKIESLQKIASDLKKLHLSDIEKFVFKKLDISSDDEISNFVKQGKMPNQGKWIYAFCGNNLPALLHEFQHKKSQSTKKFAKANSDIDTPHYCIYVGSSGTLAKRMKEHFGDVSDSTYAIRFNEWLPDDEEITCFYFEVETQSQDILQNLEDAVWHKLNPIIGKKGGK